LKLLWSSRSPFVRKVVVVAHELGIAEKIELDRVRVTSGETNPVVMQINPLNKIPALLLDDGTALFDSVFISAYLDDTYGRGELFCRDATRRRQAARLHVLGDGIMNLNIARLGEKNRGAQASEAFMSAFRAKSDAALDMLEAETEHLAPLTIGSIAVAVALGHLDFRFGEDGWRNPRPKLAEWHARFAERPSMRATEHQDIY
jgi:glutathione S-transferase